MVFGQETTANSLIHIVLNRQSPVDAGTTSPEIQQPRIRDQPEGHWIINGIIEGKRK